MTKAARTRYRILALFLPIAAALYISAEALSPKGTDQVATSTATASSCRPSPRSTQLRSIWQAHSRSSASRP
jgi:hypothetical protein